MTCSQRVHGSWQPIKGCSAPPINRKDDWSWLSELVSHGKCTSVYGYTLDWTYGELSLKAIK